MIDTVQQLKNAGYYTYATDVAVDGLNVTGTFPPIVLEALLEDQRFACGCFHGLHPEVGNDRMDFRSFTGTFGEGSLQIVVDRQTGRFHADIDHFNPYEDVVNILGHNFGEVIPHFIKKLFRRFKRT